MSAEVEGRPGSLPFAPALVRIARDVVAVASRKRLTLITAESCTSGLLASLLSEAPGAGDVLHGGFVAYSKEQKTRALGVPAAILKARTAVCPEVAVAMAEGALAHSPADIAAAITGVAGPARDEDDNPVGLVCIAVARRGFPTVSLEKSYGDIGRERVCEAAIADTLAVLRAAADR